ncbi:hypothetical protein VOLCADRAFT_119865, partial [Volvox carteri f. nagariensis]
AAPQDLTEEDRSAFVNVLKPGAAAGQANLQTLPKVAVDAAKQAGQAYVEAGKEARSTLKSLTTAFLNKPGPPITLTVDHIVTVIFFALLGVQLLLLPIFMPSVFRLVYSLLWGLLVGLGLSFIFYYNRKSKAEANELLSVNLGLKGLYTVAGGLPSWVNMSQAEKLEWLNSLIGEVWPYVDKGVCNMIKEITAKTMPGVLKTLPAGLGGIVKSIGFKHLTFGDAPFRVESIWVSPDDKESLVMELSVKWCGDPNITLAIEVPGGQKLCPRVMDISFVARVRVVLNPLVSRIPGFVALMATVPKPPLIKYRLDFGKALGGSMVPAAVTPVINFFLRDMITKMLVWPQRLVVPVLQATEQDKVEIQKLMRRHQGVLRVYVNSASELRPDSWGTNDVLVELTTDSEHYEATSIRRAKPELDNDGKVKEHLGESVAWRECIYLLIQEPKNQLLRLELFDVDRLRPTKLLTGQVSQVVNGRQLMGRSLIKLADVCQRGYAPGLTAPVGRGEWGSPGGPGKGQGKVSLAMTYWPFEKFTKYDVENAMTGIVTVRLLKVWGLAVAGDQVSAFVRITSSAKGSKPWRSTQKTWTKRGHILMLKREIDMLTVARERDLREGRRKEAERKTRYLEALGDAVKGNNKRARLTVELDYTLDSSAMHAIYHVKLTDVIKIKVLESSMLSSNECLGRLDVAVSDIVTANDFNPLTGRHEFGLHRRRWEEYNPEQPDRTIDQLERGLLLEEGDGARIWVEMRWVPCIQTHDNDMRYLYTREDFRGDLIMFQTSHGSNKSIPQSPHGLTRSNPLANDHLEGHLLPAGLDLTSLQYLLDNAFASTTGSHPETHGSSASHGLLLQNSRAGTAGTRSPAGQLTPSNYHQQKQQHQHQHQPAPVHPVLDAPGDAPDLRNLTCEHLVRLCHSEDITSDLAGLRLLGTGRHSVTCQALWRGARVAVKFTSSASLHPHSSDIIKQALVGKALAHPNVLQHYSVRCCRLTAAAPAGAAAEAPPPLLQQQQQQQQQGQHTSHATAQEDARVTATATTPAVATAGATAVATAPAVASGGCGGDGGGGILSPASAPCSSTRIATPMADVVATTVVAMSPEAAAAAAGMALHHLSCPAASGSLIPSGAAATEPVEAINRARNRPTVEEQVSDLFSASCGGSGASGSAGAASRAGAPSLRRRSGLPPLLHIDPELHASARADAGSRRVLKAPTKQRFETTEDLATASSSNRIAFATAATTATVAAAALEGLARQRTTAAGTASSSPPYGGSTAGTAHQGALSAGSGAVVKPLNSAHIVSGALELAPSPSSSAAASAGAASGAVASAPPPTAPAATGGTLVTAAPAAPGGTASPPASLSFNSYEGFGDPFGSLRHALSLAHVAALVSATEGEYLTAIIMEHADKSTLHKAVGRGLFQSNRVWNGRVALRALLRTSLELAFALQHLHIRGVVHGSLRPHNVLLKSSNLDRRGFIAKVSNFSLARVCLGDYGSLVLNPLPAGIRWEGGSGEVSSAAAGAAGAAAAAGAGAVGQPCVANASTTGIRWSHDGSAVHSPGLDAAALPFWAPEQLRGVVGKPSDVYAFGVTLYYMATSRLPYTGMTAEEVVQGVAAGNLRPQWPEGEEGNGGDANDGGVGGSASAAANAALDAAAATAVLPAPASFRALCALCWQADPCARPTFSQICASLQAIEYDVRQQLRKQAAATGGSPSDSGSQASSASAAAAAAAAAPQAAAAATIIAAAAAKCTKFEGTLA